jgi:hypothetical protein
MQRVWPNLQPAFLKSPIHLLIFSKVTAPLVSPISHSAESQWLASAAVTFAVAVGSGGDGIAPEGRPGGTEALFIVTESGCDHYYNGMYPGIVDQT